MKITQLQALELRLPIELIPLALSNIPLEEHNDEVISEMEDMLASAFVWENTEQGHVFWSNLSKKYFEHAPLPAHRQKEVFINVYEHTIYGWEYDFLDACLGGYRDDLNKVAVERRVYVNGVLVFRAVHRIYNKINYTFIQ